MDSELGTGSETRGRIFSVSVDGDSPMEIEAAALAAAQAFFGDGVPLEVVPDYEAFTLSPLQREEAGKKFRARVRVRALG